MRFRTAVVVTIGLSTALIGYRIAAEWLAVDSCLDGGGAHYGPLGCLYSEPPTIDRLVVDKSERRLDAYASGRLIQSFPISLGAKPECDKRLQGDNRTPEGVYPVVAHKEDSSYFRALRLGYPTPAQQARARREGRDPEAIS
jgi:hypothetical protein